MLRSHHILLLAGLMFIGFACKKLPDCDAKRLPGDLDGFLAVCGNKLKKIGIEIKYVDGKIITDQGSFPLKKVRSPFEADLFIMIKDKDRAQVIADAYYYFLGPKIVNPTLKKKFQSWLLRAQKIFGVPEMNYFLTLDPNIIKIFQKDDELRNSFDAFINEVNSKYKVLFKAGRDKAIHSSIAIVSGPYGGGHISVANEIQSTLREEGYHVDILDVCRDFFDPLSLATNGKHRACTAFNEFTRKKDDPETALVIIHLNWLLSLFITPDERGDLRKHLTQKGYGLIISSVHHINDLNAMAYVLDRPSIITVTDYDMPTNQWYDFVMSNPRYTQYLIPRKDPIFFRRMFLSSGSDFFAAHPRTKPILALLESDGDKKEKSLESIKPPLRNLLFNGYPTNPIISFPNSESEIIDARRELGLDQNLNRKVVTLSFGASANLPKLMALLKGIVLKVDKLKDNIQLVILSGGNKDLIEISKKLFEELGTIVAKGKGQGLNYDQLKKNKILGMVLPFMNRQDMSNLYKASDVVLSKAGGATTAELIQSSTRYLRVFGLEPWEVENAIYLERLGLSIDSPQGQSHTIDVDYGPYFKNLSMDNIISSLNGLLAKPRMIKRIENYLPYSPDELRRLVGKVIDRFYTR